MASLESRIISLIDTLALADKQLRTLINGNTADLSALTTTTKASLVAAINETSAFAKALIADAAANNVTDKTYSVSKIEARLTAISNAIKSELLNGAGSAYDTFAELQALFEGNAANVSSIMTALGNRVRIDTAAQGLTTVQQANARTNIAAVAAADVGNTDRDFAAYYTNAVK